MAVPRIRVKMCGMTREEDIHYAIQLGVDAIGVIFYSKSSRAVNLEQAKILLNNLPPFVQSVAVFVNPEKQLVQRVVDELPIQLLQFHGDESPEFCHQFNSPYIKAISALGTEQIKQASVVYSGASALLLDTPSHFSRGGTGLTFNWNMIPAHLKKPYILAGGLNDLNIKDAKHCTPFAVDVCSGIEAMPGVKDHLKMAKFIKAIWGEE